MPTNFKIFDVRFDLLIFCVLFFLPIWCSFLISIHLIDAHILFSNEIGILIEENVYESFTIWLNGKTK